ncbi:uncharacterized protein LOC111893809 [Lactuca sativa]|uniref:uncharacterized protein LOC111893809 n=1 Tax=Lactuca sativa TaxID=4236 RepID=UPI000CD8D1E2|nr:uncharacterized protein LOC111893809 [Lactuca sativa]
MTPFTLTWPYFSASFHITSIDKSEDGFDDIAFIYTQCDIYSLQWTQTARQVAVKKMLFTFTMPPTKVMLCMPSLHIKVKNHAGFLKMIRERNMVAILLWNFILGIIIDIFMVQ